MAPSASVDFYANVDPYTTSLAQAIAVTNQYSKAADTMLGRVAKIGGGMANKLVTSTESLTQANKIATAQAAAYQQKLSQIEVTSTVLGTKTFPRLAKATKDLATAYPIGIDQAVRQVETLRQSGVTQLNLTEKLAKAYTQLGAATGEYGPEVGQTMTELTRSMGNSLVMADKMGDSLTTLTHKYGGTATGVLAFAKSIAPVAATVGMSQTQVMGLSTALGRLGEDGYAAGNALNKVMLDLSRSVRDGTPELRVYAELMGKSVDQLRGQFQSDPTSVLTDFANSINKSGPGAIRTLDLLGLQGVRTVKALTSLSREGNLGEIISTASSAYGSGSAAKGAETALGGVNDQITRLNETMSQMVAGAGRPFLGFLEDVVSKANSVAGAFNSMVNSDTGQSAGKAAQMGGGLAGMAVGGAWNAVQIASTIGLARRGINFVGGRIGDYYSGRASGVARNLGVEWVDKTDTWAYRRGRAATLASGSKDARALEAGDVIGAEAFNAVVGSLWRGVRNVAMSGKSLGTLGMLATASDMNRALGISGITTEQGQKLQGLARSALDLGRAGQHREAWDTVREMRALLGNQLPTGRMFGSTTDAARLLTQSTGRMYRETARNVLGGIGQTILGGPIGPWTAGALGIGAVGAGLYAFNKNKSDTDQQLANTEAYQSFNDFAEKAGYATRSVNALGDAANKTAKALLGGQNTTMRDAYTISDAEATLATSPGYDPAFKTGTMTAAQAARRAVLMNPSMGVAETSRLVTDVFNQNGRAFAEEFAKGLESGRADLTKGTAAFLVQAAVAAGNQADPGAAGWMKKNLFGLDSESGRQALSDIVDRLKAIRSDQASTVSPAYAEQQQAVRINEMLKQAQGSTAGVTDTVLRTIAGATGIDVGSLRSAVAQTSSGVAGSYNSQRAFAQSGPTGMFAPSQGAPMGSWIEAFKDSKNPQERDLYNAWVASQSANAASATTAASPSYLEFQRMDEALSRISGGKSTMAEQMFAGINLAAKTGRSVNDLSSSETLSMSELQRAIIASTQQPDNAALSTRAGEQFLRQIIKESGGDIGTARNRLVTAYGSAGSNQQQYIGSALNAMSTDLGVVRQQAGRSQMQTWNDAIAAAQYAKDNPVDASANPAAAQMQEQIKATGAQAMQDKIAAIKSMAIQVRDAMKNIARQEHDFTTSMDRAQADAARQRKWAQQDYNTSRFRSNREFHKQMERSEDDYNLGRRRANRDFNISMERQTEDYHLSVQRAEQDFTKSRRRATQDFQTSMRRAERDYYISRSRMITDHDKALSRQIEDTAKSMYSPYERVMHKRVWDTRQLISNMAEQNKIIAAQMANVEKMKRAGLSQAAIDTLGLADTANAEQAARMAQEIAANAGLATELNSQVASRAGLAGQYATSENNVDFRRQQEDYQTALARMADDQRRATTDAYEDFNKQMTRAMEDFRTSMSRSDRDFAKSQERARKDFRRQMSDSRKDYDTMRDRARDDHSTMLRDMAKDFDRQLSRNSAQLATEMSRSNEDFRKQKRRYLEDLTTALTDVSKSYDDIIEEAIGKVDKMPKALSGPMTDAFEALMDDLDEAVKKWNKDAPSVHLKVELKQEGPLWNKLERLSQGTYDAPGHGGGGGGSTNTGRGGSGPFAAFFEGRIGDSQIIGTSAGGQTSRHSVRGRCLQNVSYAKRYIGGRVHNPGWASASALGGHLSATGKMHEGYDAPRGALYWWNASVGGGYGHVAVSDGQGNAINNWGGSTIEKHKASGMAPRAYRGWTSYAALSTGGIATRQTNALLGEGGYPEAVIPLNDRGAKWLTTVLGTHLSNLDAKTARVAPYATAITVYNTTYDQRTVVSGPVVVQTSNPTDFGAKMAAKARRDRLIQPVGSAS